MWGDRDGALQIDVPWDGHDIPESRWNRKRGYALVPMIPPEVRRGLRNGNGSRCRKHAASNDRKRFILWEVDEWSDTRLRSQPDRDPLLLEHLHGEMYIVLAQWDLTEIERMVMLGRRS